VETGGAFEFSPISLGPVGRPEGTAINKTLREAIPYIYSLIESGKVTPAEYVQIGNAGVECIIEASAYQAAGKGGNKKVIVKVAETTA
jgi:hypothetical protein